MGTDQVPTIHCKESSSLQRNQVCSVCCTHSQNNSQTLTQVYRNTVQTQKNKCTLYTALCRAETKLWSADKVQRICASQSMQYVQSRKYKVTRIRSCFTEKQEVRSVLCIENKHKVGSKKTTRCKVSYYSKGNSQILSSSVRFLFSQMMKMHIFPMDMRTSHLHLPNHS